MTPDRTIVATVDFFTPIVDDPYDFGRIAATNAFSDIYAMGATPLFALNLVGWPRDGLPFDLLRSEEHTSELQSRLHLVCRLLLEKKKKKTRHPRSLTTVISCWLQQFTYT